MNLLVFLAGSAVLVLNLYIEKYRQDDLDMTLSELDRDDNLPRIRTYDFIIVGGGGAGCVLANRLSVQYTVLLLEAGGTPVPATRVFKITEGKMLGGSTSHNGKLYNRGNPLDYHQWATTLNDVSWEYQNVLKYFKRSENFISRGNPGQHGHGGLMTVDSPESPILSNWFRAGVELGFQTSLDSNGPQTESYASVQIAEKKGKRVSSYTAFIEPIEKSRRNLRVERYSLVSEVLIKDNKKTYGVAYKRHGIPQIAHASKEVIVSCGAFGSPLLLMKSGIGPLSTLKEAGIPLIRNLPVGKTLVEHTQVSLSFSINKPSLAPSLITGITEESLEEYHDHGTGVLSSSQHFAQANIVSSRAKMEGESNWPDFQMTFVTGSSLDETPTRRILAIGVSLSRPKSKGLLSLNTTAYKAGHRSNEKLAVIDYQFLSVSSDEDVLLEGINLAVRTIEDTTAFKEVDGKYIEEKHPGCSKFKFRTDEYWRCFIQQTTLLQFHTIGTCRMGYGLEDKNGVLDSKFNVLGISNLRVVDASAIPHIPNSNIAAIVIMMAEKAADEILKAWMGERPVTSNQFAQASKRLENPS